MAGAFVDRFDAGRRLACRLARYRDSDTTVLGMARGGVAVGYAVAESLHLGLLPLVIRKVGAPANPELALGALSETGVLWVDPRIVGGTGSTPEYLEQAIDLQASEASRLRLTYGTEESLKTVRGRAAIVVDDGVATGASAIVAIRSARALGATRVVMAAPVAASHAANVLRAEADEVVTLDEPDPFLAVGLYYGRFDQLSDDEVVALLRKNCEEIGQRS